MDDASIKLFVNDSNTPKPLNVLIQEMQTALSTYVIEASPEILMSANNTELSTSSVVPYSFKFNTEGQCKVSVEARTIRTSGTYLKVYKNGTQVARFTLTTSLKVYISDVIDIAPNDVITFDVSASAVLSANSINVLGRYALAIATNLIELIEG